MPAADRPRKDVGADQRIGERAGVGFARIARLGRLHLRVAADVDHPFRIADDDVLAPDAEITPQVEAGDGGGASAGTDHLHLGNRLAGDLERIQDGGRGNDRRAVLVVVKDRNRHPLLQSGFDVEALRRLDVFQIDAAEGGLHGGDHVDQPIRVILGKLDVKDIDAGKLLEQASLAFHDRLGGQRSDVAEPEHRRAVGNHADQVGARGVEADRTRIVDDRMAGMGDTRRIGERQIELVVQPLGGLDSDLARGRTAMILKGCLAKIGLTLIVFHGVS
jgi:hypothetical protein